MNNNEKVKYWIDLSKEDIDVAQVLLDGGKLMYSGFMCHLSVEKALKAKIEQSGNTPQKIHNLIRLAELGGVLDLMSDEQIMLLNMLNPLQIETRYPAYKQQYETALSSEQCALLITQAKEMIAWIEKQL